MRKYSADDFLKEYWPVLAAAATIGGAALFLTLRYISKKRKLEKEEKHQVDLLEEEALKIDDNTAVILEGGEAAIRLMGKEEIADAANELAEATDDVHVSDALYTIGGMAAGPSAKERKSK